MQRYRHQLIISPSLASCLPADCLPATHPPVTHLADQLPAKVKLGGMLGGSVKANGSWHCPGPMVPGGPTPTVIAKMLWWLRM